MEAYDSGADHLRMLFAPPYGQPGDWRIEGWAPPGQRVTYEIEGAFSVQLGSSTMRQRAIVLQFTDTAAHQPLLHGTAGVIDFFGLQMGYYSRTRLDVQGMLKIDARYIPVSGFGWMDHEWGTADLPGSRWTFVAIQLDSGEELCAYRVDRRQEGTKGKPYGYVVDGGNVEPTNDVIIDALVISQPYGYPTSYRVRLTFDSGRSDDLQIDAEVPEQRRVPTGEVALPFVTLWEGAATVSDFISKAPLGRAFLEMGGYE
jgi:predicted secreted hydrolase